MFISEGAFLIDQIREAIPRRDMQPPRIPHGERPFLAFVATANVLTGRQRVVNLAGELVVGPQCRANESDAADLCGISLKKQNACGLGSASGRGYRRIDFVAEVLVVAEYGDDAFGAGHLAQNFEAAADIAQPDIASRHQDIEIGRCWPECIRERQRFQMQIA